SGGCPLREQGFKLILRRRLLLAVMQGRVVEYNARPPILADLQEQPDQIGLFQIIAEDINGELVVGFDLLEDLKDAVARRETKPFVLLSIGERLPLGVRPRDGGGIEL